jgi:hypothetical protein
MNPGKKKNMKKEKEPMLILNTDKSGQGSDQEASAPTASESASPEQTPRLPVFEILEKRPRLFSDLFRALLILLSIVVAAGLALILLPQPTVDKMTQDLRSRRGGAPQGKIAFLYLGDEIKDNGFHIRGVVRNISSAPIEKMDVAVRLYSHDGTILQTTLVRMNKETVAPDEIAQFDLFYPNYQSEFGSYAVEFKLRDGDLVPYKDLRTTTDN